MSATAEPDDAAPLTGEEHKPDFLGHPRGLWFLAFTEAWERFSYYGMQALLVLYMVKYLLLPGHLEHVAACASFRRLYGGLSGQALASAIFGTYTASVYLTPIFGGFLADRLLGHVPCPRCTHVITQPNGVAVMIEAQHQCMSSRGVRKQGGTMITFSFLGEFRETLSSRTEFLALVTS